MLLERTRTISTDVITDASELDSMRAEWSELWNRCPEATPFQTPEWLLPWWRAFGNGRLHTLLIRDRGCLVAAMPGYVLDGCFQLLGVGTSDHLDLLVEPGFERDAVRVILGCLTSEGAPWRQCEFQQLPPNSPLLHADVTSSWRDEVEVQDVCPVLSLPGRLEDLRETVPNHQLRNVRYYQRRAERVGAVRFESASKENLHELLSALFNLHRRRWKEQGLPGVLEDTAVRMFLRDASAALQVSNLLRLHALRVEDRIVAVLYGLAGKRRFHFYTSGFDPAFSQLWIGNLLIYHTIEEAIGEGLEEFDFLRGQESYKYLWGAKDRPNWCRRLQRDSDNAFPCR